MKILELASPKTSGSKNIKLSDYMSKKDIISKKEKTFFTVAENDYLDNHDNSIKGEISNFTDEDLKMFN